MTNVINLDGSGKTPGQTTEEAMEELFRDALMEDFEKAIVLGVTTKGEFFLHTAGMPASHASMLLDTARDTMHNIAMQNEVFGNDGAT
jgi:hypothetical protein